MRQMNSNFGGRMRAAFLSGAVAVFVATISVAAPVVAADQPATVAQQVDRIGPHTHQVHGVVKGTPASGATSFVVTTERYDDVTVTFSGTTVNGHGHGHGHAKSFEVSKASDLKDGDRVVVQGRTSPDSKTFVARKVHLLPAEGSTSHVVGTISAVSTGSNGTTTLTISPTNGSPAQTVTVGPETRIRPQDKTVADLKARVKVTVVSKNGTATAVVIMPS